MQEISKNELEWRDKAPVAPGFGDVYYSADNGLEESRFVFLGGIGAPSVWEDAGTYVIGETGFGTGLNFLATWMEWQKSGATGRLTFVSVEGYPLSREALAAAHATFPELASLAAELREQWPPPSRGYHVRHFAGGKVNLILLFGPIEPMLADLSASVDAWFLDGFAPAMNPDMWSDGVMDQIARLSHVGTRFATFTAAGFVKRALAARGFSVRKTPGYGRKRERLVGEMTHRGTATAGVPCPEWALCPKAEAGPVAVIGGGIAGASLAAAFRRRGRTVTVIASDAKPAASQVPAAILAPRFLLDNQPSAQFFPAAFAYTAIFAPFRDAWSHTRGLALLATDDTERDRQQKLEAGLGWGDDWLKSTEDGLMLPMGGSLDTARALADLLEDTPVIEAAVARLRRTETGWDIVDGTGNLVHQAPNIVIAAGIGTEALLPESHALSLRPNRGQIELVDEDTSDLPPESLAFGGYVTATTGADETTIRTLGSTFDRLTDLCPADYQPREDDRQRILAALEAATGRRVDPGAITSSWAGIRATTPDHLPYAGALPDWAAAEQTLRPLAKDARISGLGAPEMMPGLFVLSGLGSKGYQYGPLLAEFLAAQMCGEPLPLPLSLVPYIHPLRGLVRRIVRAGG